MLYYLYHDEIQILELDLATRNSKQALDVAHLSLKIYEATEKYDCPDLQLRAKHHFKEGLKWYLLNRAPAQSSVSP